ncbi:HAD family acid phosphatase [Actinoplanes derwentensis]|uniref:HAD superfamily, subfamily IIIB (Acid phosphatase) n=1 Tax=Actinoplanes derwentensis TaxID=113562 RepID=A0A1H2BGH7_9ACTN|nr:HAD family acid phosphatase [Actinoplanes derwentensis]GID87786.1 acid phosphatase [Actinoplanes derwentensis]SDT57132.1 HAD superfamily, subfamily IIIB (Acid phosphatase) [Actinoplanes derwentensis]
MRRLLVATIAATAVTVVTATPASAAALPSRATWLADVTAVTDQAADYLDDRLPASGIRAAIVLDIDNTALQSRYKPYDATPGVLALARQARADGAAVFFVTARPEIIEAATEINLRVVGYQWTDLYTRPTFNFDDNQTLKTKARTDIESRGYTIVANVGNSATDLGGGHAERTFKLPDYDGQLD